MTTPPIEPIDTTSRLQAVKHSAIVRVPRELLVEAGAVEPTDAERAAAARDRAESGRRAAEYAAKLAAARKRLAAITDPLAHRVLTLHAVEWSDAEDAVGECEGCDYAGYDAESPDWPCRTVQAVAEHYGIDLP